MRRLPLLDDRWDYKWGVVAKGLLELWGTTGDTRYLEYVRVNMDHFVAPDGSIRTYERDAFSLDLINPGKALYALLRETGDERYRAALEILRAQLRDQPRTPSGGFWHKRMYPDQLWLDGIYMASPFLAEYAATFGEPAGFGDVARQITLAFERTRDARTGLLFHAWDESGRQPWADPRTGCSRSFWGRAVGWYAMALVDALDFLPTSDDRTGIESILRTTMAAVAAVQDASGLWWQVLDQGDRPGNYLEQSASCMFAYAFAKGARRGLLPASDDGRARRAYQAVVDRFVRETADGVDVAGCCVGTGLGGTADRDGSFEYYAKRPVATNDHHGVGAFLLASVEIDRDAA